MGHEKEKFLRKLRQIEEHARALTHEIAQGPLQNRARLMWGIISHLVVRYELDRARTLSAVPDERSLPYGRAAPTTEGPWKTQKSNC